MLLNVHFHALVLDGVYTAESLFTRPVFHARGELEDSEVAAVVAASRPAPPLAAMGLQADARETGVSRTDDPTAEE